MVFDPLDGLAPLLQAAAEDIARTGPPMGNLLAGTMGDGLVFAGHGGVPFAGDNGVQVTQDWQLLGFLNTPGETEAAVDSPEDDPQSEHGGSCGTHLVAFTLAPSDKSFCRSVDGDGAPARRVWTQRPNRQYRDRRAHV